MPAIHSGRSSPKRLIAGLVTGVVLAGFGGGAYWYWAHNHGLAQAPAFPTHTPVPVSTATAGRQDVQIYLTGLGTVQATFTVNVHSQVDGKLQEVLFTEGQRVKKNDLLAKIDPRLFQAALDQAQGVLARDQAMLQSAELDLKRYQELVKTNAVPRQQLDQQVALVAQDKGILISDQAAIDSAKTNLDYTDIRAPSDGRMGVRMVDPGNVVHATDTGPIAILVQNQPSTVLFTLPAQTLDEVREAQTRGDVQVLAYDRDNRGILSSGKLATIDNLIDPTTATYRLKATFSNQDEKLWPGEFVNARVLVDTRKNALVLPNAAIQRGPQGLFAWLVTDKNTAIERPIKVGPSVGDITIVASGIANGDHVVTGGQYKLSINAPVSLNAAQTLGAL